MRPLVVVLDGPEYARRVRLRSLLRRWVDEGLVPAHDVELAAPVDRLETYSASRAFAKDLAASVRGRRCVGVGCSLGALALLHAHRVEPSSFAGLFLQSGSFFRAATDAQESGFARFARIDRFVGGVLRARRFDRTVPTTMTCGLDEENYANNAAVAQALARQDYDVDFHAARGGHDWPTWARAVKAHLPALLRRAW